MAKRNPQFQTIRTEGAILPPDILRRIASLKVDGATPDAYHLPPGTKLNEAISHSWTALLNYWQSFQDARERLPSSDDTGTAVTNESWLLPLFKELDYGRLLTAKAPQIDERTYPIERFYNHTPIHLVGCNLSLDRRTKGARGAATASPHSMVQEFLNCSDQHVWAFVSNGLQLRILRDNISLSRQTFVEFDLEAMMEGEVYADFALLWLLCHQSRVESNKPEECWLEQWSKLAREQGTRVLNDLRIGVAQAIEALGRGFIAHPSNDSLRGKLRSGALSNDEYYRQLLRIVYRLLFLFVAEDRELLHSPNAPDSSRELYDSYYSTQRLRQLAHNVRGSKHGDLWHSLSLVFSALGNTKGCPQLALSGLGSFLWRPSSTPDVLGPHHAPSDPVLITNDDLLLAIRELAYVEQDRIVRMVDYRNLGSEELGSVYESLLELHPALNADAKTFDLLTAPGSERKISGSYYTPDSLVQCLLDSTLDPVIEDRLRGKKGAEAEKAILSLKLCDPACGSGHFLIAAAHRLARQLARSRTGESEPSPEDYQHALRDVIGHCVYGVDLNPMAVELCQVSLWIEALDPGKPLSFLAHHIQCGNSLLFTSPRNLDQGILDDAFEAIEGDVKDVCAELRRINVRQRQEAASGQTLLFPPQLGLGTLPQAIAQLDAASDDSIENVIAMQQTFETAIADADYLRAHLLADTWCAAFVWHKDTSDLAKLCPTDRDFRHFDSSPHKTVPHVNAELRRLAKHYNFFHWHIAFPDVFRLSPTGATPDNEHMGWNGGFDVVLGNPPWENTELQEKQFFATRHAEIANANTASERKDGIEQLKTTDPALYAEYCAALRYTSATSALPRQSSNYPLSAHGRLNTFALFTELSRNLISPKGRMGLVIPTGIATDDNLKQFFEDIITSQTLVCLLGFENEEFLFTGIANVVRFCIFVLSGSPCKSPAEFAFYLRQTSQLSESERVFTLTADDIQLLNPNTRTCPIFRTTRDAALTKTAYERFPVMIRETPSESPWDVELRKGLFNMASDSSLFKTKNEEGCCALYEGKYFWHFDHRFASYDLVGTAKGKGGRGLPNQTARNYENASYSITPRFWVKREEVEQRVPDGWTFEWFIVIRDITSAKLERTCVAAVIPRTGVGDTAALIFPRRTPTPQHIACFIANLNCLVYDYVVRQKIGGTHLTSFILKQTPIIPPERYTADDVQFISTRVVELVYTSSDLSAFARDHSCNSPPFKWNAERRMRIRAELDAYFARLYGISRDELFYILDANEYCGPQFPGETFRVLKERETAAFGEFRTKRMTLEVFDEMSNQL